MTLSLPHSQGNARGFITMATVMIIAATIMAGVLTASTLFSSATGSVGLQRDGARAFWAAQACIEHGRAEVQGDGLYDGGDTIAFGDADCTLGGFTVASGSATLEAEGTSGEALVRVSVDFEFSADASGSIQTVEQGAWRRVAEF